MTTITKVEFRERGSTSLETLSDKALQGFQRDLKYLSPEPGTYFVRERAGSWDFLQLTKENPYGPHVSGPVLRLTFEKSKECPHCKQKIED